MNDSLESLGRALIAGLMSLAAAACSGEEAPSRPSGEAGHVAGADAHADAHADARHVRIDADTAARHGIGTAAVAAGVIHEELQVFGRIAADAERVRAVGARFAGMVRSVEVSIGDAVRSGETLATVESDESLRSYRLTAPIDGIVTRRAVNPGERAGEGALFELADYSHVWAELAVFARDRQRLRAGQAAVIEAVDADIGGAGVIADVLPAGADAAALRARVFLDNADARWTPGQFVSARVSVAETPVQRVVPLTAVQVLDDRDVVFVVADDVYEARAVRLGRRDATHVELIDGVDAGERIVVANSYLLKADIGKSGAAHDH